MEIGSPTGVKRGHSHNSPIAKIDAKLKQKVPVWKHAGMKVKLNAIFDAFVEVFRESGWHYAAGSFPGLMTNQILSGEQVMADLERQFNVSPTMDCGRIRNLLALVIQGFANVRTSDTRVTGHFITKPMGVPLPNSKGEFTCIDRSVYGNVCTPLKPYQLVSQCIFEDHYAVKVDDVGLTYDACLVSIYPDINAVVETMLKRSPAEPGVYIPQTPPLPGQKVVRYVPVPGGGPNGFSTGYKKMV